MPQPQEARPARQPGISPGPARRIHSHGPRAGAGQVLARTTGLGSHREILRLESDLGVTAKVVTARKEQTRAELDGGDLDAVTHAALVDYHEQAASVTAAAPATAKSGR